MTRWFRAGEPPDAFDEGLLLDDGLPRHVTAKLGLDLDGGVIQRRVAQVNVQKLLVQVFLALSHK